MDRIPRDPFAEWADDFDAGRLQGEPPLPDANASANRRLAYTNFFYDLYDWDSPQSECNFLPLKLQGSHGLFLATCERGQKLLRSVSENWHPNVQWGRERLEQDPNVVYKIYAYANVEDKFHYAHRVVQKAKGKSVRVDHWGGDTLDTRIDMLKKCSIGANNSNTERKHPVTNLPKGVAYTNSQRKNRVQGLLRVTIDGERVAIYSPETWPKEEAHLAHAWYLRERDKYYEREEWATNRTKAVPLIFPPRRPGIIVPQLVRAREQIPF